MLRLLASLGALASIAAALPAQQPTTADHFAPLAFLAGHCWRGTFPDGKQTDEHCFEWVFDRKFVRDQHVVRGGSAYGGETLYSWDPGANQVVFNYWNSEGQMMPGRLVSSTGDTLVFTTRMPASSDGAEIRSMWVRQGADAYRARSLVRDGSDWKEAFTMVMSRVK